MRSTPDRPSELLRLAWAYFGLVALAYFAILLRARQPPPMVDYPDWVYQGLLFHGVLTGHPVAGYALKSYPVPNSLTTVALGLLDCVLSWAWAAKVWVGFYLVLGFAASRSLARATGEASWQLVVVLPTVVFLNLDFWWGHISFEVGICLLFFLAALLLRTASTASLALVLLLLFFTHMEACACGLLLLGMWTWRDQRWSRLWAVMPAAVLTLWYGVGRYSSGNVDGVSVSPARYPWGSKTFLLLRLNTFLKEFGYVQVRGMTGGSVTEALFGRVGMVLLLAAGVALAMVCLWLAFRADGQGWRGSVRRVLFLLAGLAFLLPQVTFGVADAGSRLLLVGVALALFSARWNGGTATVAAVLSGVLCAANLVQFARVEANPQMKGAETDVPEAIVTFGHVEPATRVSLYRKLAKGQMNAVIFETGIFQMLHDAQGPVRP